MLSLATKSIKDASVLRRLEFAATYFPQDMPNYSENVAAFALKGKEDRNSLDPEQALQLILKTFNVWIMEHSLQIEN